MDERPSSQVGTVFHPFSVLYHLQAWLTRCQARRTVSAVFFLRRRSEGVLNLPHVIRAVTWGIKSTVCEAQCNKPDPRTRPPEWLYVSTLVQSWVLQWDHTARFTWHPGISQSISFLERLVAYTWHTREHILACSTWAQNKAQTFPFAGLLRPLPTWTTMVSDRTWFYDRPPPFAGNMVILTIVVQPPKSLPNLSFNFTRSPWTSYQTRDKFNSRVWKGFCPAVGAKVSLSSGFLPNGGCSQQSRVSVWFPLFNIIYAGTATSGEPPELPNGKPMDCFQRSMFQPKSSPGNWLPTSMGSLRLTPWSTLSQSSWSVLGACTEILFSMCLSSTLTCRWCSSLDRCTYLNLPGTLLVSCGPCWMNVSVSGFQCGVSLWACE